MTTPRELIALIHDLDVGLTNPEESYPGSYLEVSRWRGGSGSSDSAATSLVRALAREKLATFPLEEIGGAVLAEIDTGASQAT